MTLDSRCLETVPYKYRGEVIAEELQTLSDYCGGCRHLTHGEGQRTCSPVAVSRHSHAVLDFRISGAGAIEGNRNHPELY